MKGKVGRRWMKMMLQDVTTAASTVEALRGLSLKEYFGLALIYRVKAK
jgi:hypothetical protein